MTCEADKVLAAVSSLVARLKERESVRSRNSSATGIPELSGLEAKEALALRLDQQYPGGDVGVLSSFFLNLVCEGSFYCFSIVIYFCHLFAPSHPF